MCGWGTRAACGRFCWITRRTDHESHLFGAALLAAGLAGPATAQEVIYNPGYCAQFYPNANCQNKGPGNPYTGGGTIVGGSAVMPGRLRARGGTGIIVITAGIEVPFPGRSAGS